MKSLNTSLILGLLCGIWIGTVISIYTTTTTTRFRKQLTMKYGPEVFNAFKYGTQPKLGDYPAVAKVRRLLKYQFYFCGGTILTLDKVLTSYLCVYKHDQFKVYRREGEFTVTAGTVHSYDHFGYTYDPDTESFIFGEAQMRHVAHFITSKKSIVNHHSKRWWPRYETFSFDMDLIVLVLTKPFIGHSFLKSVKIWTYNATEANRTLEWLQKPSTGVFCKILSFGYEAFDPVLTLLPIKVLSDFDCRSMFCYEAGIKEDYLNTFCFALYPFGNRGKFCAAFEKKYTEDYIHDDPETLIWLNTSERFGATGDGLYCHGTFLFGISSFKLTDSFKHEDEELGRIYFPFVMTKQEEIIRFLEEVNVRQRSVANLFVSSLLLVVLSSAINILG